MNKQFGQLIDGFKALLVVSAIIAIVALTVFLIPFIIGLGLVVIVGGITYFFLQSQRESKPAPEKDAE